MWVFEIYNNAGPVDGKDLRDAYVNWTYMLTRKGYMIMFA